MIDSICWNIGIGLEEEGVVKDEGGIDTVNVLGAEYCLDSLKISIDSFYLNW